MEIDKKKLKTPIKMYREQLGLDQSEVWEKIGVGKLAYIAIESGEKAPTVEQAAILMEVIGTCDNSIVDPMEMHKELQQFKQSKSQTTIAVSELIPYERNTEFFDDITGEEWNSFLESVRISGVISPVVVTLDNVIVSGHQRIRACKELEIEQVEFRRVPYDSSESDILLLEIIDTNLRQRGGGNVNGIKLGECIKEIERIKGIKQGNNQHSSIVDNPPSTQGETAKELNISLDKYKQAKRLQKLISEVKAAVESQEITETTVDKIFCSLSPEEQKELLDSVPVEERKETTQKQWKEQKGKLSGSQEKNPYNKILQDTRKAMQVGTPKQHKKFYDDMLEILSDIDKLTEEFHKEPQAS